MGIKFEDVHSSTNTTQEVQPIQEVQSITGGITLDLSKNVVLDLTKRNPGLKKVALGAGWNPSRTGAKFDLDISAFMLHANGKISSGSDVVYYKNKVVQGVSLGEDNTTGDGEGDDETIDIDLSNVASDITGIVFCVSIFEANVRRQTFGMINDAYVRLIDRNSNDKELCRYRLKEDSSTATAVIFAKLVKNESEWDFETIGEGLQSDLNGLAARFM